ncbi:hypothetical protein ABVT39_011101 [Epinephelus coioides]
MKTVILALVVLLIVSQGEALRCWCGGIRSCSGRTETCSSSEDVCASVSFTRFQISEQTRENMKTVILALVVLLVVSQEISEQTREDMKTVILALVVLLVVSQGEALECWCGGIRQCSGRTETCRGSNDVCASVHFLGGYQISGQTRENMKTVILALVVLLVVSQGEALVCWCGGTRSCSGRTETCRRSDNVCASVRYENSPRNNFHGCYQRDNCQKLNHPGVVSCGCCNTDRCQAALSSC